MRPSHAAAAVIAMVCLGSAGAGSRSAQAGSIAEATLKTFLPSCVGKPLYKPRLVRIACGDGNLGVSDLRWRWSNHGAVASGRVYWNDCLPHCFEGHWHSAPGAILRLHGIASCNGYRAFARVRLAPPRGSGVTGVDERRVYPYIC
jgi:hypothetical protein